MLEIKEKNILTTKIEKEDLDQRLPICAITVKKQVTGTILI
jgi:hypothetical protein